MLLLLALKLLLLLLLLRDSRLLILLRESRLRIDHGRLLSNKRQGGQERLLGAGLRNELVHGLPHVVILTSNEQLGIQMAALPPSVHNGTSKRTLDYALVVLVHPLDVFRMLQLGWGGCKTHPGRHSGSIERVKHRGHRSRGRRHGSGRGGRRIGLILLLMLMLRLLLLRLLLLGLVQ